AVTARVRSTTDGASRVSLTRGSCRARFEALADHLLGQVAADEHDPALALLVSAPRALVIAVEDHVHTLEHETVGIALEREDALGAQDARPFLGDEILHPGKEFVRVERLLGLERDRLHVLVVIMLEAVMVMAVVMGVRVVMRAVVMIVIVPVAGEKFRLDVE